MRMDQFSKEQKNLIQKQKVNTLNITNAVLTWSSYFRRAKFYARQALDF